MALLDVESLTVRFGSEAAPFTAVDSVDLSLDEGEIVGCVGESGSGKSVTALALLGLIDFPGRVHAKTPASPAGTCSRFRRPAAARWSARTSP